MPVQINFHGGPFDGERQVADNIATGMGTAITVYTDGDKATGTYTYISTGPLVSYGGPAYSAGVIALGPALYYRLDEASGTVCNDSSGNGRNGTYNAAGVTYHAPSLLTSDPDTAVTLNGTTGFVQGPVLAIADVFSIEAWINLSNASLTQSIVGHGPSSPRLRIVGGKLQGWYSFYGPVPICDSGAVTLGNNTAYHCVWTKNAAANHLYLNGADVTANVANQTFGVSGYNMDIGHSLDEGGAYLAGTVDEVAVYGFALSAAQVATNYSAGSSPPPVSMSQYNFAYVPPL